MTAATERTAYEVHPLAHLMPAMRDAEYEELREDIAANGLREPITLYEGKVLDGRHRYRACEDSGIWPVFQNYDGDSPAAYVLSLNVKRRHLSTSQLAMLATDFLPHLVAEGNRGRNLRDAPRDDHGHTLADPGSPEVSGEPGDTRSRSATIAAEQVGASASGVERASRIKRENPELAEQVRKGEVTVNAAYEAVAGRSTSGQRTASPITRDGTRKRPAADLVENVIGMVQGLPGVLQQIDVQSAVASPDAPLADWDKKLTGAIVALGQLRKQIRGAKP